MSTRQLRDILTMSIAIIIGVAALSLVRAQESTWSTPVQVSTEQNVNWFPDLAVTPDGAVHVIWAGGVEDPTNVQYGVQDLLYYRVLRGGAWSRSNDIANPGGTTAATRNSLVVGPDGRLHALIRSEMRIEYISAPSESALSALSWSKPVKINGDAPPYYNDLAVDSTGRIHAFWTESVPNSNPSALEECPFCSDMFYRRSDDGGRTWTIPTNLFPSPDGANRPQVKIDRNDRIHLVWSEGFDFIAGRGRSKTGVYRQSSDGGMTWSVPFVFDIAGLDTQQIAIGLFNHIDPVVVYRSVQDDRIFYQISADGGKNWNPPGEIPGVKGRNILDNNLDAYSMATDSAGRVHLLLVGFLNDTLTQSSFPKLLHLVWDGTKWTPPNVVMDTVLLPEWPQLTVQDGRYLHAVWFTRHKYDMFSSDQGAYYQIWYSTMTVDSPALAPQPVVTSTRVPTGTQAPTATPSRPTPTTLPHAVRTLLPPGQGVAWKYQDLLTIGLTLVPTAGLILLCVVILAARRR